MTTLKVDLGERSYPIHISSGALRDPALFEPHITGAQVMIVTNDTVGPLYADILRCTLSRYQVHIKSLPDGEKYKDLTTLASIFDALIDVPCDRQVTVVALGGGVVGDIAGFAAACYQRGVAYVQVPTTLLAQVDSSVGGKTAVNHARGKNMIGAFHQPQAVVTDPDTLNTLPDRELRAGLAEVIKYGLIRDAEFFAWLEAHIEGLLARDPDALEFAIARSCRNKAEIVAEDELERGQRALLNLGHTFGHAIETATGYGSWLHGEAVATGMVMAADLSRRLGNLTPENARRVSDLLQRAGLPTSPPADITVAEFLRHMALDKKVSAGRIRLVLMREIGSAYVTAAYPGADLEATLRAAVAQNPMISPVSLDPENTQPL